jgi:hypothetical protein
MPALFIDSYAVRCKMLEMLKLDICLCYSVDAPQQTQVNRSRNRCRLRVAGCASCKCCLYYLLVLSTSYKSICRALAVQTRCLRKLRLLFGLQSRDIIPAFPLLRCNPKLCNPNPKHYNYVYNLNANPSNGVGQRTK